MTPRLQQLPYHADSADLFESIRHEPWAVFLDSGRPMVDQGRYDILSSDPYLTLVTRGEQTEITSADGTTRLSGDDPLKLLREALSSGGICGTQAVPFCGGAIGYFSYDLARRWERLPSLNADSGSPPEMAIGLYDWALVVDHQEQNSWLVGAGRAPGTFERWQQRAEQLSESRPAEGGRFELAEPFRSNLIREDYQSHFETIQRYIRDGDCYQVNFAQRFQTQLRGDVWAAYRRLRQINPAPFGAFQQTPFLSLLSSSPERFLWLRDRKVETRPIKGTARRSSDPVRDEALGQKLAQSAKDRAENLMIVDLLRNDLGRVCEIGSVKVPRLFDIETFARVHHLVSTVEGVLGTGRDALDLLRACFPGGSITGAPKRRAMEIIEELESCRRGIYCGSIGYIGFDGNMDSNIAIRTLCQRGTALEFWAGGGIVADSRADEEYQETLDKAAAILEALSNP
jgi:para-aminobenzoate synthetase component 1